MIETIKRNKMFTADEYEKEEEYLREMSLKGWHFVNLNGLTYTFEKGEPKSYCYRLDFVRDVKLEKDYYIKMYEDCGWAHIFEFKVPFSSNTVWQYFRIESQTGHEEALFSDNESKVDMLIRVRGFYTVLFAAFFGILLFNFLNLLNFLAESPMIIILFAALDVFIVSLYVKILLGLNGKIRKLKEGKANGSGR